MSSTNSLDLNASLLLQGYLIGDELRCGQFSVVKKAVNKSTGRQLAVKIIDHSRGGEKTERMISRELAIVAKLRHTNIVEVEKVRT